MTIGITDIGFYIANNRIDNLKKADKHGVTEKFIRDKIGFVATARKKPYQKSSDLCVQAYRDLASHAPELSIDDIDFICVCTQNGDHQLPQTSAILQNKLGLSNNCAAFDISLGCSGYAYALHIAKGFMENSRFKKGLIFTSDPYSDIIDPADKHTDLIFGDAATVTLLTENPIYEIGEGVFETHGQFFEHLIKRKNQKLVMNGRGIFNFTMLTAPKVVKRCLSRNSLTQEEIDLFVFHQASKYIVDNLCQRMKLDPGKVPFTANEMGNTVSSSIPIVLGQFLHQAEQKTILICGFGVGLSIAASTLRRK